MRKAWLLILFVSICSLTAAAQAVPEGVEQDGLLYSIDSVAVTASRVPVALHASARTVTLLDSAAIAAAPVQTVNDLLKYSAGVDVRQRGAFGMQTDVSIRGGTYNQVAVLLNGINITDPQTGHNSFDFPVILSDIDHIEILEGPAARVYGTSAMMGAINIVTKAHVNAPVTGTTGDADLSGRIWIREANHTTLSSTINLEGGSFGYYNLGSSLSFADCHNYHNLSFGVSQSKGFSTCADGTPNTDFKAAKLFYSGAHEWTRRNLTWHAGISGKWFGAGTFYSTKYDNQYESTAKVFMAVKSEGRGLLHFTPALYWNHGEDEFQLFRDEPDKYPYNYHKTDVLGLNLNCYVDSRLGRTAFGAEARHEAIRSTNLGEPLTDPKGVYVRGLARTAYNLFLEHNVNISWFSASAGVTAVYNTGNNECLKFFPGADASIRLGEGGRVFASWNSSYRMPTFTDLYYSVGGHLADPNLKSEKMNAVEIGLKFSARGYRFLISAFGSRGYDLIDWIKDTSAGEDAPWTSVNHGTIGMSGKRAMGQLSIPTLINRPGFFIRDISLDVQLINEPVKTLPENYRSMYSLEYVRGKSSVQANFDIWKGLTANVSFTSVDRATSSELIKPYHLLDAKLDYKGIYVRFNNLLNRTYYDFGEIPQPGFWFTAGISLNLSGGPLFR